MEEARCLKVYKTFGVRARFRTRISIIYSTVPRLPPARIKDAVMGRGNPSATGAKS
jgi:hypothetical protein